MGFGDAQVVLNKQDYFTGDVVQGQLVFQQDKVKTFRGIYVRMKGHCKVHWTTRHSRRVNDRTEHYTRQHDSYEVYYYYKHYLIGRESGETHLQPGRHEFPFQFVIPPHSPSSYEGSNGRIRHELKFVVDRAMNLDQEKRLDINVKAIRDLNADPYCKEPMFFEFHESYCCWCVNAGVCDVNVRLPASGYTPGQVIPIEVSCENKSNVEIDTIKLEIKEETTFRATHEPDTRYEKDVVAKIKKGPVPGNTAREWTVEMEVPHMDVRNVDACAYIDVTYDFEVSIETGACHKDHSTSARLVLGHIPLREFANGAPAPNLIANQPVAPLQQFPGAHPGYPGANPPFPAVSPYPANPYPGGPPYLGANPPPLGLIPPGGNSPFPGANPPFPGANSPFPGANPPPYPGNVPPAPYASPSTGFTMLGENKHPGQMPAPMLPPGGAVPYYPNSPGVPSPYAASAPVPATPDSEGKKPPLEANSLPPPYNPDFEKVEKKPE